MIATTASYLRLTLWVRAGLKNIHRTKGHVDRNRLFRLYIAVHIKIFCIFFFAFLQIQVLNRRTVSIVIVLILFFELVSYLGCVTSVRATDIINAIWNLWDFCKMIDNFLMSLSFADAISPDPTLSRSIKQAICWTILNQ